MSLDRKISNYMGAIKDTEFFCIENCKSKYKICKKDIEKNSNIEDMLSEKVSVIVPIYNVSVFLKRCIESICRQTFSNLEIILIDDGSTDQSGSICDYYSTKDSRIKVIHKNNAGVSAARNDGIDMATGDYLCFVDGDDYVMSDYVQYMINLIHKYETDISLSTELFTNYDMTQSRREREKVCTGIKATEDILCYNIPIGVYNKLFKKEFLGKNIRFLNELCIGEGFNFNVSAFQKAKRVAVGNRKIYFYRKNNKNSVTTKFDVEKWKNGIYAIQRIKQDFIVFDKQLEKAWEFAWWRTNTDVYDQLVLANATGLHYEMFKNCKKIMRRFALSGFRVPTSKKQRIRSIVILFCPQLIPQAMIWRRKIYGVDIKNG